MSEKKKIVYEKKNLREHIYDNTDTYAGSDKLTKKDMYIYIDGKIVYKNVKYVEALLKIIDEGIVNSYDASVRTETCNIIKVWIKDDEITIYNNGEGIETVIGKEGVYNQELIFGHLLTSSNYNKEEQKVTGGKNGYGAKLINIFSKRFTVETVDTITKKKYVQEFTDNMTVIGKPKITACKSGGYVKISFLPEYQRFGIEGLSEDMIALIKRRVYDLACCANSNSKTVKVYFNDELIKENTFVKYVGLYYNDNDVLASKKIIDISNERWKVVAVYEADTEFRAISFVNGVYTADGGKHVDYVVGQIISGITELVKKKNKDLQPKPQQIKDGLHIYVNSIIVNPSFTSQTKNFLTTPIKDFGSKYTLPEEFIKKLATTGLLANVVKTVQFREKELAGKKMSGKKVKRLFVEKLRDATNAGGKNSESCYLILCEGDSASALAIAAFKELGHDNYGVFPLKGKILNVREATNKQLLENKEINNIITILGLKHGKEYTDVSTLRYGHVMMLADQDYDGSHIKGLFMNMIHRFWPSLLTNVPDFIVSMPTPIIKAFAKKKENIFYTIRDYEKWKEDIGEKEANKWTIKYYKGLGTSTAKEACEYFKDMKRLVKYKWNEDEYDECAPLDKVKKVVKKISEDDEDDECNEDEESDVSVVNNGIGYMPVEKNKCADAMTLAFSKERADHRKGWLMNYDKEKILDNNKNKVTFDQFIHDEMKHFSNYDCERSIPNMVDGFKPSLRKIMYCVIKKNIKTEIKVAQLAGYVGEKSAYHHGEASLHKAIIGMAQDYVGANNINMLLPNGQFGTRLEGGKDAASPRYIFTAQNPVAKTIFVDYDNPILSYLDDDGTTIEPEYFIPIIPTILVNGALGIGTGFSTRVQPYNPLDIVKNIRRLMDNKELKEMTPWYKGFKGTVTKIADNKYELRGVYTVDEKKNTVHITELPVGIWTSNYIKFLENIIQGDKNVKGAKKIDSFLVDFKDNSYDKSIDITLKFKEGRLAEFIKDNVLESKLKLVKPISTSNMYLYNEKGIISKYKSVEDILYAFYNVRLLMYGARKEYMLKKLEYVLELLKWKRKFIKYVVEDKIIVSKRRKDEIIDDLVRLGFPQLCIKKASTNYVIGRAEHDGSEEEGASYNYITSLPLFSLTTEQINKLDEDYNKSKKEFEDLQSKTEIDLWSNELDLFMEAYLK